MNDSAQHMSTIGKSLPAASRASQRLAGLVLQWATQAIRLWAGLKRREVQVDYHRWVYLTGGKGEAVLFVHGFGADKDGWGTFLVGFVKSYHVIVPDLPGFGENSKVLSASYDVDTQVARLNRFVEAIGLSSFHLAGVSMGGYIAAYYATQYPEKVKSLALIDSAGVVSPIPSYAWQLYEEQGRNILLYRTSEQFDELMAVLFHRAPPIPAPFKRCFLNKRARSYDFHQKIVNDLLKGGMDLLENRLHMIEAKTLVIWGANDLITHVSSVEKFENSIEDVRTVIIENCGHVPFLEKPGTTRRAYKNFLAVHVDPQ